MSDHVIVWDLKNVPDIAGYAAAKGLDGKSDDEVPAAMGEVLSESRTREICMSGLKQEILEAAEEVGFVERVEQFDADGKKTGEKFEWVGDEGRKGYLKWLAVYHPAQFAPMLSRYCRCRSTPAARSSWR